MQSFGSRIKFNIEGDIYTSHKIYSNGYKSIRIVINKSTMKFFFVEPITNTPIYESKVFNNFEVLQRHVKKQVVKMLGIPFTKEKRNVADE